MKTNKHVLLSASADAGATILSIIAVSSLLRNFTKIFDESVSGDSALAPIIMLLLLVISATITSFAVFGKPIIWYLDGKKKEALGLLGWTIGFLVIMLTLLLLLTIVI